VVVVVITVIVIIIIIIIITVIIFVVVIINSIKFNSCLFTCKLNSTEANYKVSTSIQKHTKIIKRNIQNMSVYIRAKN
jgi:glutamine cyclotransferase